MEIFIPKQTSENEAFAKTTHLAVAAHQDDVEFMTFGGIVECFGKSDKNFSAIITTNGSGSPRAGVYEKFTDEEMMTVRKFEQKTASTIGDYAFLAMLDKPSSVVKDKNSTEVVDEIYEILLKAQPEIVYTHNLADKHDTHIASALRLISAIRKLPDDKKPKKLIGCEVWRGLDWLSDSDKVILNVSDKRNLASALMGVYDSQISGGKAYDLATTGRALANATYFADHEVDTMTHISFAVDMSALMSKDTNEVDFINNLISNMQQEIQSRINNLK